MTSNEVRELYLSISLFSSPLLSPLSPSQLKLNIFIFYKENSIS